MVVKGHARVNANEPGLPSKRHELHKPAPFAAHDCLGPVDPNHLAAAIVATISRETCLYRFAACRDSCGLRVFEVGKRDRLAQLGAVNARCAAWPAGVSVKLCRGRKRGRFRWVLFGCSSIRTRTPT
jgi:hypothetical protein